MQWSYILHYAFYGSYYDYLFVFILMKKFLFSINVCVFITVILFYC